MTSLSTSISRIRARTAGGWREAPFAKSYGDADGSPRGIDAHDHTARLEHLEPHALAEDDSYQAPSPRSPELAPVISRLLAFCEALDHRIIGISSDSHGSGVSLLTRELARGYAELGRAACLVDASRVDMADLRRNGAGAPPLDLRPLSRRHRDGYNCIDLRELPTCAPLGTAEFRESLSPWTSDSGVVLVDLPPVCEPDGTTRTSAITIGAGCDMVLFVCLTGVVKSSDFCRCLMQCRAGRMKVGGVILNDWKLTASHLLPGG